MSWSSAAEFFAMGGYAAYVWGSFGLVALCMVVEPLAVRARAMNFSAPTWMPTSGFATRLRYHCGFFGAPPIEATTR